MKRPGDTNPAPKGGRAAARLRMFERARKRVVPAPGNEAPAPDTSTPTRPPARKPRKRRRDREEPKR
jgi:hypothetical protein